MLASPIVGIIIFSYFYFFFRSQSSSSGRWGLSPIIITILLSVERCGQSYSQHDVQCLRCKCIIDGIEYTTHWPSRHLCLVLVINNAFFIFFHDIHNNMECCHSFCFFMPFGVQIEFRIRGESMCNTKSIAMYVEWIARQY